MAPDFELLKKGNIQYYTIPLLANTGQVVCAFTTRHGGVSEKPYDSMNMAFHVGDDIEKVRQNRKLICDALGIDAAELVAADQVHGDVIKEVVASDLGQGAMEYDTTIPATDALMTNVKGVPLSTYYADCVPVFLMDPVKGVIALAHAGWKGTVALIGYKTVDRMTALYGCRPEDMIAGIAPSIGPCCYEVDSQVADKVKEVFPYWPELLMEKGNGKWQFNLWEANKRQLMDAGLQEQNIAVAEVCTACHSDLLFSHRADGGKSGRMAALLMLK